MITERWQHEAQRHLHLWCSLHPSEAQTGNLLSPTQTPARQKQWACHTRGVLLCLLLVCVYHACGAPDVCGRAILCSDQNLKSSVLSGLDVLGEVFVLGREADRRGLEWDASSHRHHRKSKGGGRRLTTQQAFPRSAIFTFSLWALPGSSGLRMNSEALKAEREGKRGSDSASSSSSTSQLLPSRPLEHPD